MNLFRYGIVCLALLAFGTSPTQAGSSCYTCDLGCDELWEPESETIIADIDLSAFGGGTCSVEIAYERRPQACGRWYDLSVWAFMPVDLQAPGCAGFATADPRELHRQVTIAVLNHLAINGDPPHFGPLAEGECRNFRWVSGCFAVGAWGAGDIGWSRCEKYNEPCTCCHRDWLACRKDGKTVVERSGFSLESLLYPPGQSPLFLQCAAGYLPILGSGECVSDCIDPPEINISIDNPFEDPCDRFEVIQ